MTAMTEIKGWTLATSSFTKSKNVFMALSMWSLAIHIQYIEILAFLHDTGT